ncbi:orotidine-5'-phosphate decarboxylase [Croceimicrobium sp.]|uniref:orotidine-5'-phosphate decarboxylase n=1 Tax=Croceimicrobium sp. TaxID=2828340 RepID=UPI003BA9855F
MKRSELEAQIQAKKSVLCVGLDTDLEKIPAHLLELEDPIFEFNKAIIDATHFYAVAYKPNLAFYEAEGLKGWQSLEKTLNYLNQNYPELFTIADAKRGDIGNTSARYAKAFFEEINFDSITVAPYMGSDSVKPFLGYAGKWVILLALTSNPGGGDFQLKSLMEGNQLYQEVLRQSSQWGSDEELMYVVGATKAEYLKEIRKWVPNHYLLVPGVGAQGGTVSEVMEHGKAVSGAGLLINSSRGIIYASQAEDFAQAAGREAAKLQAEMAAYL